MPINSNIPLSGIAPPIMRPQEQLSLIEIGRQMKERADIQRLQSTPGMLNEDGIYTDQGLTALGQINPSIRDQAVIHKANILAQRSLQAERDMLALKRRQDETHEIALDADKAGLAAYYSVDGGQNEKVAAAQKARNDYIQKQIDSGVGARLGWKPEDIQKGMGHPFSPMDAMFRTMKPEEAIERSAAMQEARQAQPTTGQKIVQGGEPPAEPITMAGAGPDETVDTTSGAVVRPETRDQLPEGQPLGEEEQQAEQPVTGAATEVQTREITDTYPPDSTEGLRDQAKQQEAKAERLRAAGATKSAKTADDKAKELRAASVALEQRIQKERDQDLAAQSETRKAEQEEKRLQMMAERLKLQKDAEIPDDVAHFVAKQYVNGNSQAIVGWARNLQAKAAIGKAIVDEARKLNLSAEAVNAKLAEFQGVTAGQRTLGTREANLGTAVEELANFIPLAKSASHAVPRTGFVPLNKLYRLGRSQWSPEQARFEAANRALINAFAQVASRSGGTTVHNTEEAENMLNTAQTQAQYDAVADQLMLEAKGARKAPGAVRRQLSEAVRGEEPEEPGEPNRSPDRPGSKGVIHWNDLK